MTVIIEPIGNLAELVAVGNSVETVLYEVFTERYMITQYQIDEVNREVRYDAIND